MAEQRKNYYYVEGNTVRKLDYVQPEYVQPEISQPERVERPKKEVSQEVRRNQERALSMDGILVGMLALATIALLYICISYLSLQSSITTRLHNIEKQEVMLAELQEGNRGLASKINDYADLEYIYKVATEELGMVHPAEDQVIVYDRVESEYVRQYENIPN